MQEGRGRKFLRARRAFGPERSHEGRPRGPLIFPRVGVGNDAGKKAERQVELRTFRTRNGAEAAAPSPLPPRCFAETALPPSPTGPASHHLSRAAPCPKM